MSCVALIQQDATRGVKFGVTDSREEGAAERGSGRGATHMPLIGGAQNITFLPSNTYEHDFT